MEDIALHKLLIIYVYIIQYYIQICGENLWHKLIIYVVHIEIDFELNQVLFTMNYWYSMYSQC